MGWKFRVLFGFLFISLAASIFINVQLMDAIYSYKDKDMLSVAYRITEDADVLLHIENDDCNAAKKTLKNRIGSRAFVIGMCIENACVSEGVIGKLKEAQVTHGK